MEVYKIETNREAGEYVFKIPYTATDDFGNEVTMYRKEETTKDDLLLNKEKAQGMINEGNAKIAMGQALLDEVDAKLELIKTIQITLD